MHGKNILITGGSSGIGYALSQKLREKGAMVYSFDKDAPRNPIDGVTHLQVDITDSSQISRSICEVPSPIHVLCNIAGVLRRGTILETAEDEFDLLFRVNLKGSWLMLKHAESRFSKNPTIVQMCTDYVFKPKPNPGTYILSKKAVYNLAEMLQLTYPEYNVKSVFPGVVDTPLLRYGKTDQEIAQIKKTSMPPEYVAEKVVMLIESTKKKLIFKSEISDFVLE